MRVLDAVKSSMKTIRGQMIGETTERLLDRANATHDSVIKTSTYLVERYTQLGDHEKAKAKQRDVEVAKMARVITNTIGPVIVAVFRKLS